MCLKLRLCVRRLSHACTDTDHSISLAGRALYRKKVQGTENSALNVRIGAFPVRLFLLNKIISEHIESAIDKNLKEEIFIRKENKMAYRQNNSQGQNDRIRFDLLERIGVLSRKENGWTREVNIVAWNDGPGKVDIRDWNSDHNRMTRGITLFEDEAENLTKVLARRYGLTFPGNRQRDEHTSGRMFGELTETTRDRSFGEPAGGSAGEAAEEAAGQSGIMEAAPAAAAAEVPEAAAACVAESAAQLEAAAPA